jgi:PAS domain S-box-containing protein
MITVVLLASILLRVAGVGYSLLLLSRSGDKRFGFLTLMLSLMAIRQILTARGPATNVEELPGLAVSVLAILTVYYLSAYVEDERRMSDRIQEANRRLRHFKQAVEHAGHAIFLTDAEGTITYANPAIEKVTGHPPEEIVGENPRLWKSGKHDEEFYAEMWEQITSGSLWEGEVINRRASGELCWVDLTIAPITDEDGDTERYVAVERDITDRKEREVRIEDQKDRLEVLNNTNKVLRQINRELVGASTREAIERRVCDRLADSSLFAGAVVIERALVDGSYRVRTDAGETGPGDRLSAADWPPVDRALEERSPVFLDGDDAPVGDIDPAVVVPLVYREADYGALVVTTATDDAFDTIERDLFADLGPTVADAISAVESKQTLGSTDVTELEFRFDDIDDPIVRLADELACTVELERVVHIDGERAQCVRVKDCDSETIESYVATADNIPDAQLLCTYEGDCLFRFALEEESIVDTLASYGGAVVSLSQTTGSGRLVAEVSTANDVRALVEALQSSYPDLDLVAQRTKQRDVTSETGFRTSLEASLTDRQFEAAQTAYLAGFFEWPRRSSGEEVAAAMDISQSTFTQHLRAAEAKIFSALFEDAVGTRVALSTESSRN